MYWWRSLSKNSKKIFCILFTKNIFCILLNDVLVWRIRDVWLKLKFDKPNYHESCILGESKDILYSNWIFFCCTWKKEIVTIPFQDSLKFAIVIFFNVAMYGVDQRVFWATQIRLRYQSCLLIAENVSVVNNSMKNCRTIKRERWSQKKKRPAVSHVLDTLCEYILHASATATSLNREK